jgi:hypothetical protein
MMIRMAWNVWKKTPIPHMPLSNTAETNIAQVKDKVVSVSNKLSTTPRRRIG